LKITKTKNEFQTDFFLFCSFRTIVRIDLQSFSVAVARHLHLTTGSLAWLRGYTHFPAEANRRKNKQNFQTEIHPQSRQTAQLGAGILSFVLKLFPFRNSLSICELLNFPFNTGLVA
jgi:hypothetical protein